MGDLVAGVDEWTLGSRWSHDLTSGETFWRVVCPVWEVLSFSMSRAQRAFRIEVGKRNLLIRKGSSTVGVEALDKDDIIGSSAVDVGREVSRDCVASEPVIWGDGALDET